MFSFPFLDELLQIKDNDLARLIEEENPDIKLDDSLDFGKFFEQNTLPEEDIEYLKKEYLGMIYDDLPDDAFNTSDEKIDVDGKSVKTEKIKMHLTEKQLKTILSNVFTKASKDKKLMKIIKDQYQMQEFGAGLFAPQQTAGMDAMTDEMIKDFEQAMKDANKGLKDIKIPDGMTSTIWTNDKLIVKRDFSIKAGPNKDQLGTFHVKGTQTLEKEKQQFAYTFGYKDQFDEGDLKIDGTLSNKDGKIKNAIKLTVADTEIDFDADETLKDGKRDFERKFTFKENDESGGLIWTGDADYDKDQMKSNHKLTLDGDFLQGTKIALNLKNSAKTIKKVTLPKEDNVKDLGNMKLDEIEQYFMNDVSQKAQQYFMQMVGPGL
ncbi:DUF6583 family protein [Virgibacillus halophilus]|uniref:DUF6583 family protein n=1 Tax=Tigheibacillus halophilus TaxID=361280 RepID=A0ABU5CC47_9BACI|nr:DUF6583 family protein [Virgibacillus halophilus]